MFNSIKVFSTAIIWRKIFADFGAVITDDELTADINIYLLNLEDEIKITKLKRIVFNYINKYQNDIINSVFGKFVVLPTLQLQIIITLFKTDGADIEELKMLLGYAPGAVAHAVDTAIYQLRKKYGRDFITNNSGKYVIRKI